MVQLPTQKSEVNKDFKAQKFAMLGAPGIGKSAFWAQDPQALFIETEQGLNALQVYKLPIRSWGDLREAYGALKQAQDKGSFPYSVVVIDTIDRLVDYAQEEIVINAKDFYKKIEINTLGDIPNGMGWFKCKEIVNSFLNKMELLPCAIAYISHLSLKRVKEPTNEYDKSTISVGGQLGEDLLAWADHIMHIESHRVGDKLQRIIWTIPTQSREAKSRGGMISNGMKWQEDMVDNYKQFRQLFK